MPNDGPVPCPLCGAPLANDPRGTCHACHTSDRNRCVFTLYEALRPLLAPLHGLNLTVDQVVTGRDYFAEETRSVYLGENSIDVQSIGRPDDAFDFAVCNHVLEHVPDDRKAIAELFRVCRVAVQITVPITAKLFAGAEYGFADPAKHGHFRHYGADFPDILRSVLPEATILSTLITDPVTGNTDTGYLVAKDAGWAQRAFDALTRAGQATIVSRPPEKVAA